jgi:hypothetical protein
MRGEERRWSEQRRREKEEPIFHNMNAKHLFAPRSQARTYLFCAIRPEVQFLKYTFATLGFAKNASVVKLAPKKVRSALRIRAGLRPFLRVD